MPLCSIHLLSLHTTTSNPLSTFLSTLRSIQLYPLIISRVISWVILPEKLSTDTLLAQNIHWDLLVILSNNSPLPPILQKLVQHQWNVIAGIPSVLPKDFSQKNQRLLHPDSSSVPKLTGALDKPRIADSAQNLELSSDLLSWIRSFYSNGGIEGKGAVSMLNLLSFKPGMKDSYLQYGKAFSSSIGSKRGGNAKLVGTVLEVNGQKKSKRAGGEAEWDEIALAHYPSILHFADMLASEDYQEVNKKYRVPALTDTFILCTSEIGVEEGVGGNRAKL
ncbi:hypothetical protein K469DRAFT_722020 [Zopfia rhizophila CBS 207.26]|uniref:DUF1330 domain-containing protein n=1 Tax=Zopfia rhizophila CBS 207.26 TaxID=1314779 RepID=A0A6A6DCR3_9PEZI|nr:hypothetical protein K469DRAFT_722020 [Zopfia rhizophila CBS 207.26]